MSCDRGVCLSLAVGAALLLPMTAAARTPQLNSGSSSRSSSGIGGYGAHGSPGMRIYPGAGAQPVTVSRMSYAPGEYVTATSRGAGRDNAVKLPRLVRAAGRYYTIHSTGMKATKSKSATSVKAPASAELTLAGIATKWKRERAAGQRKGVRAEGELSDRASAINEAESYGSMARAEGIKGSGLSPRGYLEMHGLRVKYGSVTTGRTLLSKSVHLSDGSRVVQSAWLNGSGELESLEYSVYNKQNQPVY